MSFNDAVKISPLTVFNSAFPLPAFIAAMTSLALNFPAITWYFNKLCNMLRFSALNTVVTIPFGNLSNAALVGANTVNGPALHTVFTRLASITAAISAVWSLDF